MTWITYEGLGHNGRLGNQLWQIASTVGLSIRHKGAVPMFPSDWWYRPFFSIPDDHFASLNTINVEAKFDALQSSCLNHIDPANRMYMQDLSLWAGSPAEQTVLSWFRPSPRALDDMHACGAWWDGIIEMDYVTAMHVRRGDYVTNPPGTMNALPLSYYKEALAREPEGQLVIFTDDPAYCEQNFPEADLIFNGEGQDYVDLFAMAACNRFIISNSTFSWWAAWLSGLAHVVYPDPWYGEKTAQEVDFRLMIPADAGWRALGHEGFNAA